MSGFLTDNQKKEYKQLHKKSKDKQMCDRIKCILALDKGHSYSEVADILMADESTLWRWKEQFEKEGMDQLLKNEYKGKDCFLSKEQQKEVEEYLKQRICLSAKEVCDYVKKKYEIKYTSKGMTNLLYRLKFVYKKPKHLPSKADRETQEKFIEQYKELKEQKNAEDKIYFMDGCHPMHNSQLGYGWIKKGEDKFVKANTGRQRVNINAAYSIEEHKVIVREDESINSQSTRSLIEQIMVLQITGKIYLIADNAKYYRAKMVREFLEKNPRVEILFLPPYSPNLNLIERLWKFVKKKVTCNEYYEKFSVFKEKIMGTLSNMDIYQQELESLMTENFHLFPLDSLQTHVR
jgi:transposase